MAATGEIVRVVIKYAMPNASEMLNVLHYALTAAGIDDDDLLDSMATWCTDVWADSWAELASDDATVVSIGLDIVNTDGTVKRNIGTELIGVTGDDPGTNTSAGVAGYILANTSNPKARGSKYLPGITETALDNGKFSAAAVGDLAAMLVIYLANITIPGGIVLEPGLLSKATAAFIPFVAAGLINDIPAYQRRRKPFVGS